MICVDVLDTLSLPPVCLQGFMCKNHIWAMCEFDYCKHSCVYVCVYMNVEIWGGGVIGVWGGKGMGCGQNIWKERQKR